MSLYEQYFSEKNKSHMFSLITKLLTQEMDQTPQTIPHYQGLFHKVYPEVFETSRADSLVTLNKELVDTVGPQIMRIFNQEKQSHPNQEMPEMQSHPNQTQCISLYSSDRLSHSKHRYNYYIRLPDDIHTIRIQELIVPGETSPLFSFPDMWVRLTVDDQAYEISLSLEDTKYLGDSKYLIYIPDLTREIPREDPEIHVEFLDHRMIPFNPLLDETHQCHGKHIIYKNQLYFCLNLGDHIMKTPYHPKDTISVKDIKDHIELTTIQLVIGKYVMCPPLKTSHVEGILHIMNISYQHRFKFII